MALPAVMLGGGGSVMLLTSRAVEKGAIVFEGRLTPPPLRDTEVPLAAGTSTTTVMLSWKCQKTPQSIFFRSEYVIFLFFAAS